MAKGEKNVGWSGFFMVFTVLCAILMILAQEGMGLVTQGGGSWQVLNIYKGLTRWAVPALFMVWGMCAMEGGKPNFRSTLLGLALPCFVMLVFWGALYAVVGHLLGGGALSWRGVWNALVAAAKGETYFHLWVLYPLIGLYLVHPMIHRFTASASRKEVCYFLTLCFLFGSLLPVLAAFYPNNPVVGLMQRLDIGMVVGYVGFYVVGWYLHHYTISRLAEFFIYILGVLGLFLTILGDRFFGGGTALWQSYTAPGVAMTAVAVCTLFRYVLGISEERSRRRAVAELGCYAFGIYLFHQIWMLVFRWFGISVLAFAPVFSIPLFTVVVFLLSAPLTWLLYLIPGAGKWLT